LVVKDLLFYFLDPSIHTAVVPPVDALTGVFAKSDSMYTQSITTTAQLDDDATTSNPPPRYQSNTID